MPMRKFISHSHRVRIANRNRPEDSYVWVGIVSKEFENDSLFDADYSDLIISIEQYDRGHIGEFVYV